MQKVIAYKENKINIDCEEGIVVDNNIELNEINTEAKIIGYVATVFNGPLEVIPVNSQENNTQLNSVIDNDSFANEVNYFKNRMFLSLMFLSLILIVATKKDI